MECHKIISLERNKSSKEYLKYFLFGNRLICISSISNKIKEYEFADRTKMEEKLNKIVETKLNIGFIILNENINPVFYNQFNQAMKGIQQFNENENSITYRFLTIKDDNQNTFIKPYSELSKQYLNEKYSHSIEMVNLFSTFSYLDFRIDLSKNGIQHVYRFAVNMDNIKWHDDEPVDKLNCELGKSVLNFIEKNNSSKKDSIWINLKKSFKKSTPIKHKYFFFSKGITSYLDSITGKIYSIRDYEPIFNEPIAHDEILVHENAIDFMQYAWNRLQEDISYSLQIK